MQITIGRFNPRTGQVPVTFTHLGVQHYRMVNACLTPDGKSDRKATVLRVDEVALGVAAKIEAGVLA